VGAMPQSINVTPEEREAIDRVGIINLLIWSVDSPPSCFVKPPLLEILE
jgi:hypothetical protein